jgi:hypothetical protein
MLFKKIDFLDTVITIDYSFPVMFYTDSQGSNHPHSGNYNSFHFVPPEDVVWRYFDLYVRLSQGVAIEVGGISIPRLIIAGRLVYGGEADSRAAMGGKRFGETNWELIWLSLKHDGWEKQG